jgi:hypothetical protein
MAAIVLGLVLCLVSIVHGMPVDVEIAPPPPLVNGDEPEGRGINLEEFGGGVEGDMLFPDGFDPYTLNRGVAIFGDTYKWPKGVVPYDISAITNANDQKTITDAMQKLMFDVATPVPGANSRKACIYFRPRQATDTTYFKIQYGNGCSAHVGHMTYHQSVMTLQQVGCFYSKTIQHELMHIIGFRHEQSRPDRDSYLQVNLENVQTSMQHNFNKYAWSSTALNQDTPYDYASIMHYGTTAFSMNGKPTMVPRTAGVTIGNTQQLSPTDIAEVRHLYGCQA